jgi:cell wall-associated NlpC family hydrolase
VSTLDKRLNAYRPDLADARLQGRVDAQRFVAGQRATVAVPVVDLRPTPRPDAGLDTQLLLGDVVTVFEEAEGFAWVQAERDNYVGYVAASTLTPETDAPTHIVAVTRTFTYRNADMKTPATSAYSIGNAVRIVGNATTRGTDYALLASGEALVAAHLQPVGTIAADYVTVAETLERTPYLWGGKSAFGIDCSGLVQLSLRMAGRDVLRDTDMQAQSLGTPLEIGDDLAGLQRGDLVFWKGHVAIMVDAATILHASGHTMQVCREPLRDAVDRIAYLYSKPIAYRRP